MKFLVVKIFELADKNYTYYQTHLIVFRLDDVRLYHIFFLRMSEEKSAIEKGNFGIFVCFFQTNEDFVAIKMTNRNVSP